MTVLPDGQGQTWSVVDETDRYVQPAHGRAKTEEAALYTFAELSSGCCDLPGRGPKDSAVGDSILAQAAAWYGSVVPVDGRVRVTYLPLLIPDALQADVMAALYGPIRPHSE